MLYRRSFIAVFAVILTTACGLVRADALRVMTFNIRYGTAPDGDNVWPNRRELVAETIRGQQPDLIGLQEALRDQLDYLTETLPEYAAVGVGREAAGGGEYSAILYRRSRFDLSDAGTFWLSATPEEPGSKNWGNNLPRICTWVRLLDRTDQRRLAYFNTHWDHESQPARLEGAKLMAERVAEASSRGLPVIVTGDFNAAPSNPAMRALVEGGSLLDSFAVAHPDETNVGTFNGFGERLQSAKIDAVLVSDQWRVDDARIIRPEEGGRYPSDHFPVTATLSLPTAEAR